MAFPLQEKYVNLLTDFGFKRVFGSEPNKALLLNPDEQDAYQSSLKYYRDLHNVIDTSWQEGLEQGLVRGQRALIQRLLERRLGQLPRAVAEQLEALSLAQLEALGDALLDFTALMDLAQWLEQQNS